MEWCKVSQTISTMTRLTTALALNRRMNDFGFCSNQIRTVTTDIQLSHVVLKMRLMLTLFTEQFEPNACHIDFICCLEL